MKKESLLELERRAELRVARLENVEWPEPVGAVRLVQRGRRLTRLRRRSNGRARVEQVVDVGHQLKSLRAAHPNRLGQTDVELCPSRCVLGARLDQVHRQRA